MRDLAATAQQLRQVKRATRRFLTLWALDAAPDRMGVTDCGDATDDARRRRDQARAEAALADYRNHDWTLLYRGSVLDD